MAAALLLAPATGTALAAPVEYPSTPVTGWRINSIGRAVLVVGDTVYVGGTFTAAVAPNGSTVRRANLAAFDRATMTLRTQFVANTNGRVLALASDGTRLFVGGEFTTVNGVSRSRVAALDLVTGAVVAGFRADALGGGYTTRVSALEVSNGRLFIGGAFGTINRVSRSRVAAVMTSTGALLPFAPNTDAAVMALAASPDGARMYVGGWFKTIGGVAQPYLAALDSTTGKVQGPAFARLANMVMDLDVSPDGTKLFAGQGSYGNQVTAWDAESGKRLWRVYTDGDVQAVRYSGGNVFFGFHESFEGDTALRLLAVDAATGEVETGFQPPVSSFYGVWDIDATPSELVIAGEFRTVSGVASRGVASFS